MRLSVFALIFSLGLFLFFGCGSGGGRSSVTPPASFSPAQMMGDRVGPGNVQTDGSWIVWDGVDGESAWFHDGTSILNFDSFPDFEGRVDRYYAFDGQFVLFSAWMGLPGDHDYRLFYYDTLAAMPGVVQVTDSWSQGFIPALYKGIIVWMVYDGHNDSEIYFFDLNSGFPHHLSFSSS